MKIRNIILKGLVASAAVIVAASCSDSYLETSPDRYLEEDVVTENMQKDPSRVQAYVEGAYVNLYSGGSYQVAHDDFGLAAIKLATDCMADDIAYNRDIHFFCWDYQLDNRGGNYRRVRSTWNQLYSVIDNANTIITMLKPTEGGEELTETAEVMLGEAYSLRALCYFWLVNIWQHSYGTSQDAPGVPVKTEIEYRQERVPVKEVYTLILSDIQTGYDYLEGKGFHNGKVGISEYAAAGLYANILMFTGDYTNAAAYAETAIKGGQLNSENDMLSGFNTLSLPEVLWGYSVNSETTLYYASFFSHADSYMIGYGGQVGCRKLVASDLYNQIADNDVRKKWFGLDQSYNLLGVSYEYEENAGLTQYISNKFRDVYITGTGDAFTSAVIYMRIAEMYFVAAEAYYLAGNETKAREILNTIMVSRIPGYSFSGSGDALYNEICVQKRIETWMEGCRYLDVKRRNENIDRSKSTNHAADLPSFKAVKYAATDYRMIYRLPDTELENNPAISPSDDNE